MTSIPSDTACPLCESVQTLAFPVDGAPGVRRCSACGFTFAPAPSDKEDETLYDAGFGEGNVHPTYERRGDQYVIKNEAKLNGLLDRFDPFRKTGRILDIGCSAAFFLHLAQKRGWKGQGVEIAPWAANFSQKELGVDVYNGMLQDAKFDDASFDVVFSSHVMEHIGQPLPLLQEMARVLRPGGAHVTVVPTQFYSPTWLLTRRFYGDPPPTHASFYSPRSYSAFLKKAGLRVQTLKCNIELIRLRDMFRSSEASAASWDEDKRQALAGEGKSRTLPVWAAPIKAALNTLGTALGVGDEMLVIAVKE
jgi:SAM-dependent methyltransferase